MNVACSRGLLVHMGRALVVPTMGLPRCVSHERVQQNPGAYALCCLAQRAASEQSKAYGIGREGRASLRMYA